MDGRSARLFTVAGSTLLAACLVSSHAHGAEARANETSVVACEDPRLSIDAQIAEKFRAPALRACEELKAMKDVDSSVRLSIAADGEAVVVRAHLGDGRIATRHVHAPEALEPTVEALAVVPPSAESAPQAAPAPSPRPSNLATEPMPPRDAAAVPRPASTPAPLTFELGATVGGHLAGSPTVVSPSLSGYAGLRPAEWLLAVTVRWDPAQALLKGGASTLEMDAAGGGFLLTRRAKWQDVAVELGASAELLVQSQSYEGETGEQAGSAVDARLGIVTRGLFGGGHRRLLVSFNGAFSPARLRHKLRIDPTLPALPAWDLGLGIGAAWGEP